MSRGRTSQPLQQPGQDARKNMPSPREQPNPNRNRRRQDTMPGGWLWVVVLLLLGVVLYISFGMTSYGTIDYTDFKQLVLNKNISKVTFKEGAYSLVADIRDRTLLNEPLSKQIRGD